MKSKADSVGHVALGRLDYVEALTLQRQCHARRVAGRIGDVVLTVEHSPVFTIGRSGSRCNVLVPQEALDREGITVVEVERGGDITYHGPGQLVVYPILDLRGHGRDIKRYVERLEGAAIDALASYGVEADRRPGFPGVWVGERKVASIGITVRNWVTFHGLALNVDVNRVHFGMINPCGLGVEIVSIADFGDPPDLADVEKRFIEAFAAQLGREIVPVMLDGLLEETI